ncbi:hypothetical protein ACFPRL_15355 [Pseudoclavibacter helvolus]
MTSASLRNHAQRNLPATDEMVPGFTPKSMRWPRYASGRSAASARLLVTKMAGVMGITPVSTASPSASWVSSPVSVEMRMPAAPIVMDVTKNPAMRNTMKRRPLHHPFPRPIGLSAWS